MSMVRQIMGALVMTLVLAGCESGLVAPEGSGEVQVGLQGSDPAQPSASRSMSPAGSGEAGAEGSVDVRARVYLRGSAGEWVELPQGVAGHQTVRVDGRDGVQAFAAADLAAGTYGRVRIEFEEVRASLTGATIVLPGIEGEIRVAIAPEERVTVERDLDMVVRAGGRTNLTINLNSEMWISEADASTRTVTKAAFESAVMVKAAAG